MRLKRKVRVTCSIYQACLLTIPVLPKLTVDTALPWTVQYQRHLETTLADAHCPLNYIDDLIQALADCRTVTASPYWRLHRITLKMVLFRKSDNAVTGRALNRRQNLSTTSSHRYGCRTTLSTRARH